ncbi:hypothetical protein F7725_019268 [Dissostichus mawsoni]|uniref:Uncharacterized protein n=1 Tax=Dissostichus mawsoni TaxID=36200 RepID=A0A7J5YLC9_DISMA|nr:hypothetical protein F7725_019268 [Dissostichus mawsoni]
MTWKTARGRQQQDRQQQDGGMHSPLTAGSHSLYPNMNALADSNKTRIDEANQRATKMLGSG